MKFNFSTHTRQPGQSLVELGLMLMIILWLLAGAIDFGVGFFSYVAIRDAAQEGALYGSIVYDQNHPGYTVDNFKTMIEARVRASSSSPVDLTSTTKVQVQVIPPGTWCAGNPLRVNVTYQYPIMMPMIGIITGPSITLQASATSALLVPLCT
jgi:Flp pilus assembly protein TadG